MSLRNPKLVDFPNPKYEKYGLERFVTIILHHGGELKHSPTNEFVGGNQSKFDFVDIEDMCISYLNGLGEELGYMGPKRFYRLDSQRNKFRLISYQTDVLALCDGYSSKNREFTLYLEADEPAAQIGSSYPISVEKEKGKGVAIGEGKGKGVIVEDEKGKWVAIEGGGSPRFDEEAWDEVFRIVDSYGGGDFNMGAEGDVLGTGWDCDQGVMQVDLHSEGKDNGDGEGESNGVGEGDSLHESEYGLENEEDEEGVQEGEQGVQEGEQSSSDSDNSSDSDFCVSEDDFDSEVGSDAEGKQSNPVFNPTNIFEPKFEIGMIFSTKKELREAVHCHAVSTKRSLKITKNDKRRIYAKCLGEGCEWRLNALKLGDQSTFQIREYNPKHKCARSFHVKNVNSKWLSGKYEESFRTDPNRNVKGFRKNIIKDIRCHVSKYQAYRAKRKALNVIEGKAEDQFDQLWDYAAELRASNPRSTVIMAMSEGDDGTDPNNNLYPLAYAVMSGETRESWEWYLELLKGDLNVVRDDTYTFISDKQKGLVPAFESVFLGATNRFCVRHLHNNMKIAGFRGLAFKKALWNAARATTLSEFNLRMEEMGCLDPKVVDWLSDKPPEHWSRSHFSCFPKCDMLLNNVCETFNSCILEAREKPILTMLEWIREFIMTRLSDNRDMARKKWGGKKICPRIRKIVEKNIDKAADYIPIKSDDWNYEICSYDGSRYVVNLQQHTCTCRKWDLTGIPCNHGMSAICSQSLEPEDFVNKCYSVERHFLRYTSMQFFQSMGHSYGPKTGLIPPLPPNFGRRSGRPSKARRFELDEPVNKGKKRQRGQKNNPQGSRDNLIKSCVIIVEKQDTIKRVVKERKLIIQPLKMLTQMTKQQPLNSQQEKEQHHLKTNRKRQLLTNLNASILFKSVFFAAVKKDYKEHTTSSCYRIQPSNINRGDTTFIA
ncbi:UNVERIFIED_CONTAM: hypothetical protein Sradi_4027900 [Sesamum radiatum]|uniref:SWIM-type domain-containing protein n=1 Tax=Sesamum radiatum TaxID=300843 RepID=A0AAW2PKU8_SESRA